MSTIPHSTLITRLVQKRLTFPTVLAKWDNRGRTAARQLDAALISIGFKLSKDLLTYIGDAMPVDTFAAASLLIEGVQQLVGDNVKHNVYFRDFPKNVPDTLEFWGGLLARYYEDTGTTTSNLLDFPTYGSYQHTYEEMVAGHARFKPKTGSVQLKTINLGRTVDEELVALYTDLAGSRVPLNPEDRSLLEQLYTADFRDDSITPPVRENRAIVNALRLTAGRIVQVDSPVDVLRIAAHLSGGDVTLTESTKFKSFKRPMRRLLMGTLNLSLVGQSDRVEEITRYREEFKRLSERLHPNEFHSKLYPAAVKLFAYAHGNVQIKTWANQVHTSIQDGRLAVAIRLLSEKPGYLIRNLDKIARESNDVQFGKLADAVKDHVGSVSGRVLISLSEHLDNRRAKAACRLFVNRSGGAWATPDTLEALAAKRIDQLQFVLWKEISRRIPIKDALLIDPIIETVAIPVSEKTKSEGFRILPRGSVFGLDPTKDVLRFFLYWHEKTQRTDFDLSAMLYDKDFNMIQHLSYTRLTGQGAVHSGDITSAPNGASEFIDLLLSQIPTEAAFIVPTINHFAGDTFAACKSCFFGFMSRDLAEKGKPFEAATVQLRFDLCGDKKVGVPMVFFRDTDGSFKAKWLDLYLNGQLYGNRVENNKYSAALLAKSLVNRRYLTMGRLLDIYRDKAKRTIKVGGKLPTKGATYIGLERPEGIPADAEVFTLDNLKALIPA